MRLLTMDVGGNSGTLPESEDGPISTEEKIRVLHLGSPVGLYGAERWILALVKYLPSASIESIVGVINDDRDIGDVRICREAESMGLRTIEFESHGRLSLSAIRMIREYVREQNIHILHTHGYKTDIIGTLATRGTNCKIVATPHGWSVDAGMKLQAYEFLDRLAFQFVDAVVPLSPELYKGLEGFPGLGRKLHLILNGVDLSGIDSLVHEGGSETRIGGKKLVFGYIGQLITRKRVDTLIEAFDGLNSTSNSLWIIGDGPQRGELEAFAAASGSNGNIRFFGFRDDRLNILSQCDVFVLPSALEGIPRCLMEAMAAGIPVIASNIPGCTDLVEDGNTGVLFECGSVQGLRSAMLSLIKNVEFRQRIAKNGQALIRDRYSASTMASKYAELYSILCDSPEQLKSH